jgi:succinoglycan biosynthesis protein ExoH
MPFAIIIVLLQYYSPNIYEARYILYPFSLEGWLNGLLGLFGEPLNGPLYFLRDLFVIAVVAPFYWMVFKKIPYIGLAVIIIIFTFNLDGYLVLRDSMYVAYYIGVLAARQKWDLKMLDQYAYPLFTLFIMGCVFVIYNKIDHSDAMSIVTPFLVWPILSKITYTRVGDFLVDNTRHSFLLFLSHTPIMFIFYQLYLRIDNNIPYLVFWLVTPIITTFIILKFLPKTEQFFPPLYRISTGQR